jgi:hypothetical protein
MPIGDAGHAVGRLAAGQKPPFAALYRFDMVRGVSWQKAVAHPRLFKF